MIRALPREVVERIAAGEVIERPASVVKELVENALDAGATRIDVDVEGGGKRLVRVRDDGFGIAAADLPLAFAPHATSKLSAVDDLLAIASYGFRGEALSSIGAVGRARIVTRGRGEAEGHEITCEGGRVGAPRPCGAPTGTTVEARNLFFNVPARARFQKSEPAEAARCLDALLRLALVADGVGFRMTSDGRVVFEVAGSASRRVRAAAALGDEVAADLIESRATVGGVHVHALLAPPSRAKGAARHQYLFLNGRAIQDGTLRAALRQAYREFLAPALQPAYVLSVTLDPAEVDVNVHPAKSEVRFRDSASVFRAVHAVVLEALRGADLAPRPARDQRGGPAVLAPASPAGARPAERALFAVHEPPPARVDPGPADAPSAAAPAVPPRSGAGSLTVFATYVLFESGDDLVIVDQHALHERVLYERLRAEARRGAVSAQRLLAPVPVEIGRAEALALEERLPALKRLGLEVTPFGPASAAVHAVPRLLSRADPAALLHAALAGADPERGADPALLEERLHDLSCRAAVKAGDRLTVGEIEALLDAAAALPEAKACPHGRPTSIRLARGDLERWFKRRGF